MTILYTITAYPPSVGGAQLHLHELARRMAHYERVGVVYQWDENRTDWLWGTTINAPPPCRPEPLDGVPACRLSLDERQRQALRGWVSLYWLAQGAAIERIAGALLDNLHPAAFELLGGTPTLIHNSRVGREGLTAASLKLARRLDVPFVLTPNHHHVWRGWFYRHYIRLYRQADAVIALTQVERDQLIRLGVRPERLHVLGIGPVLAHTWDGGRFRTAQGIPADAPMILFVGQKYAYKRFDLLLRAAGKVWQSQPQARFVFIGPRTRYSRRIFARITDPRIIELDTVSLQDKTDALAACDVLCVPSARESFGGVYLEAWGLGKPVIGGDAPALREVITDGQTGYLVGNSPSALAGRLEYLLGNAALRQEMGERGRQTAARFTWPEITARLKAIYDQLRS
jgi:glycosyltransferase involved in cell wall biosynthesis